jgi:hypothetical protein
MRIHHIALRVRDLEAAREFYSGLLGLPEVKRDVARAVWLRAGVPIVNRRASTLFVRDPDGHRVALSVFAF